jgi:hypothetical protein
MYNLCDQYDKRVEINEERRTWRIVGFTNSLEIFCKYSFEQFSHSDLHIYHEKSLPEYMDCRLVGY